VYVPEAVEEPLAIGRQAVAVGGYQLAGGLLQPLGLRVGHEVLDRNHQRRVGLDPHPTVDALGQLRERAPAVLRARLGHCLVVALGRVVRHLRSQAIELTLAEPGVPDVQRAL
jgi:hypothetical protein